MVDTKRTFKAVTFDAGGTLIHLRESVGVSYSKVAGQFDISACPDALDLAFREAWKTAPPPGFGNGESEKDWWRTLVKQVFTLAAPAHSGERFDPFFERLYDYFAEPGVWVLDEDAAEVFRHLREIGVKTGMISNFDERLRPILEDLDFLHHFDAVAISNEVRSAKPDSRIFAHAAEQLDLDPGEILHVGDDPVCDGEGAEKAGMEPFLVGKKFGKLSDLIAKLPLAPA